MKVVSIILIVVVIGVLSVLVVTQGIKLVKDIIAYRRKRKEMKKDKTNTEGE